MLGKDCPQMDLLVTIDIEVSPAPTEGHLGVVLDDKLQRQHHHGGPIL